MAYSVYLVSSEGVRAEKSVVIYNEVPLTQIVTLWSATRNRFVILDDEGIQVFASDKRDETGAYIPNG